MKCSLVMVIIICLVLVSCGDSLEMRSKKLKEKIGVLETYGPVQNKSLRDHLPSCIEIAYETEKLVVYKYEESSLLTDDDSIRMSIADGCSEGKFIYSEWVGVEESDDGIKPVYKQGFMNRDFTKLTEAVYEELEPFSGGLAIVRNGSGYGVVGSDGRHVIQCEHEFKPEIAAAGVRIPSIAEHDLKEHAYYSSEGLLEYNIRQEYEPDSLIPRLIKILPDATEMEVSSIPGWESDILLPYKEKDSGRWGYADGFGVVRIDARYDMAYPFVNGYARVIEDGKFGFADAGGALAVKCKYDDAHDFSEGLAAVAIENKYGFININGDMVIDHQFNDVRGFVNDGAAATRNGAIWGYIRKDGVFAIRAMYAKAGDFCFGYSPVYDINNREYTYIDHEGHRVLGDLGFFRAYEFNEYGCALAYDIKVTEGKGGVVTTEQYFIIMIKD